MAFTPKDWRNYPTDTSTPLSAQALEDLETRVTDYAALRAADFNVKDYGAAGDEVSDDTAEIQAAIDAAIPVNGKVVFPPGVYRVTDTLTIEGAGAECYVDFEAEGGKWYEMLWDGGDDKAFIHSQGWKRSKIDGIHLRITSESGVCGFEIDDDDDHASSSQLVFTNCSVVIEGGSGNIGWRLGHSSDGTAGAGPADISGVIWNTCQVTANSQDSHIGWVWEHQNCLMFTWINCGGYNMEKMWTATPTSGAASLPNGFGGDGMTFIGCGVSLNETDFEFAGGTHTIHGGRFEVGNRFLDTTGGGASATNCSLSVAGVVISDYGPSDDIVFNLARATQLSLDGAIIFNQSGQHTAAMITASTGGGGKGAIVVSASSLCAADPFHTITAGDWTVVIAGTSRLTTGGLATTRFADTVPRYIGASAAQMDGTLIVAATLENRYLIVTQKSGDSNYGVVLDAAGRSINLGPGSGATDFSLVRSAAGFATATSGFVFPSIAAASAPNNSLFKDTATGKLSFKDNGGVTNALY